MANPRLRIAIALTLPLGLASPCRLVADSWHDPTFGYVAKWKQYHKGSSKIGLGTAQLIHPQWVITAYHVAKFKHQNPDGGSTQVVFQGGKTRNVVEVYKAPGVDIALAKLNSPMNSIEPVSLLKQPFKGSDGVIDFTIAGRSGGLHYHRVRGESRLGGDSFRVLGDPPADRPSAKNMRCWLTYRSCRGWIVDPPIGEEIDHEGRRHPLSHHLALCR